jgi:outer membrane receptor protein involved in Fe transport
MYKENIGVRGFYRSEWNQNIIFLVNGVRQRSGYDFNNKLSYINVPVQSIQRVEVIKGPAAVSYGSGAFFGVVNIVTTEQESSSSNSTDFSLGLGTQKTSQINFNSSKKVDGYLLGVNLGGQMSDGIEQNFKNISGDTSLSTKRFMNEKSAYFGFYLQKKHLFTTLTFDRSWNNRTVVSPPYVSKLHESSSSFLAARYLLRYFTKYKELIDFNASYNYQHQQEELEFDLVGLDYNQEYQNTTVGQHELDINFKFNIHKKFSTSVGCNGIYIPYSNDFVNFPIANLGNVKRHLANPSVLLGTYARIKWIIMNNLTYNGGLRIEKQLPYEVEYFTNLGIQYLDPSKNFNFTKYTYPKEEVAALPEMSLNLAINSNNNIKLAFGEAINRIPLFRIKAAQEGVKPERISSLELNYIGLLHKKVRMNSSVFYNYYYNLIVTGFAFPYNTTNNSGKISTLGFECDIDYKPIKQVGLNLSGNYYETKNLTIPEASPAYSPNFLAYFKASYSFNTFSVGLTSHYVASTLPKTRLVLVPTQNGAIESKYVRDGEIAPGYFNTGINMHWTPMGEKGLWLNIRVSNLFDERMYYPVNDFNPWAKKGTLGIGRTVLGSIGYTF